MRLSKFLFLIILATCLSCLYVWQQSEIFRLAYLGQKNSLAAEDLLDKNTVLRYNIERNTSLIRITHKVAGTAELQMPDTYRLVRLASPQGTLSVRQPLAKKESIISRLFSIKRQAEAKTINPSVPREGLYRARSK